MIPITYCFRYFKNIIELGHKINLVTMQQLYGLLLFITYWKDVLQFKATIQTGKTFKGKQLYMTYSSSNFTRVSLVYSNEPFFSSRSTQYFFTSASFVRWRRMLRIWLSPLSLRMPWIKGKENLPSVRSSQ